MRPSLKFYMVAQNPLAKSLAPFLKRPSPALLRGVYFFKQQPYCRLIARTGAKLIGQIGLDFRAIRVGQEILEIVGLIDLCVARGHQGGGVATSLVQEAERFAQGRAFSVLMADDHRLYQRAGYGTPNAAFTRQLAIESLESHSIVERDLSDCFMAKPLGGKVWSEGKIDLLGYLF